MLSGVKVLCKAFLGTQLMQRHGRTVLIVTIVAVVAGVFALNYWLDQAGVCRKTWSTLSDDAATKTAIKSSARLIPGLPAEPTDKDLQSYIQRHPGCCSVLESAAFEETFGPRNRWVRLLFPPIPGLSNRNELYREALVAVSPCGHVGRSWTGGIPESELMRAVQ